MEAPLCLYKPKEYSSTQEIKWCPGCGDYAVYDAVKKAMSELCLRKEEVVVISGIGCSSRFPYYMDTYGFHTIHGRPAAVATGVKLANPDLHVWIVTGDGDSLAIGANHFVQIVRRNVDVNLLLFNNEIYGLTKGQHSPTTKTGFVTKSAPFGTIETPFNSGSLVLGAEGQFFARVPDTDVKLMTSVFIEAEHHRGTSVVEILQNCVIFNDGTHEAITAKANRADTQIILEHGMPMVFGANRNKGLRINGLELEVVTIGENSITMSDVLVHDAHTRSTIVHDMLIRMQLPEFPIAMGVIRAAPSSVYDVTFHEQLVTARSKSNVHSVNALFTSGNTFEVKP